MGWNDIPVLFRHRREFVARETIQQRRNNACEWCFLMMHLLDDTSFLVFLIEK